MFACGLDFGTSNSSIGVVQQGRPTLAPVDSGEVLIPSAVFFDYETKGRILFGSEAIATYIGQTDGRLMRALKTILGSPLIDETTALGHRKVPLTEVVEIFIRQLKARAESFAGHELTAVVHGRPVRFVENDEKADARAEEVLRSIAERVGFRDIAFIYEPLAAAYQYEQVARGEEIVLIADIGGGTSDFTVIRIGPQRKNKTDRAEDILANAGVRIGGTDFDTLLNLATVMPELGLGTFLHKKNLPMPKALYYELATWATINFTYTFQNERELKELVADSRAPEQTRRLLKTIRQRLGHRIAFSVEDAKIALSDSEISQIPLSFLEHGLSVEAPRAKFERAIAAKTNALFHTASQCIRDAGLKPAHIQTVFFTGGSGRVPVVRSAIARAAPNADTTAGSDLVSVALGLTREAAKMFG